MGGVSVTSPEDGGVVIDPVGTKRAERIPQRQLATLLEVSSVLASSLELPLVLQRAVQAAVDVFDLDTGAIYILDDDTLFLGATTPELPDGFPDDMRRAVLEEHPLILQCMSTREVVSLDDATAATLTEAEQAIVDARGLRTIVYVPLLISDRAIGAIIVGTTGETRRFKQAEIDLAFTLAYEVALAVANAQLYEDVREANALLVSHRAHLEELVEERTRELSEANEAKDRFLAAMSHELRTPLNSIIGFSGILEQEMGGPITDEQRRQASLIGSAGRHLLEIIEDILDLSKVGSGRVDVDKVVFDAALLVREVVATLQPLAQGKDLELQLVDPGEPCDVESDAGLVRQILVNLIGNAIKFTDEGTVTVGARCAGDRVIMTVADTGPGIPAADLAGVFDAFTQFNASHDAKPTGTGLGLALSREYAGLIDAELSAESVVGEGSTFTLTAPRRSS